MRTARSQHCLLFKSHFSTFPGLTRVVVVIDGHRCRVVVTQHGLGRDTGVQRCGADFRISDHPRVAEVDVEVLVLLEDVVVDHPDCNLCEKNISGF